MLPLSRRPKPRFRRSRAAPPRPPHGSSDQNKAEAAIPKSEAFVLFYSWQSDLPDEANRRLIRQALRAASSHLEESSNSSLRIIIDEATRDVPGSPNIPQTILDKVRAADAFAGDITTVSGFGGKDQRPSPNPNVLVELGFAVAHLGWNRIILLFNTAYGAFPADVPFDIDRHRISPYEFAPMQTTEKPPPVTRKQRVAELTARSKPLFDLVEEALGSILKHRPPKPASGDELTPVGRKRRRDTEKLEALLTTIHIPTIDIFLDDIQTGRIPHDIFHFWEGYRAVVAGSLFHLNDQVAASLVRDLSKAWAGSLDFGEYFVSSRSARQYIFRPSQGEVMTSGDQKAWELMQSFARATRKALDALLAHVRADYVDIDIDQTTRRAWTDFVEFHDEFHHRTRIP